MPIRADLTGLLKLWLGVAEVDVLRFGISRSTDRRNRVLRATKSHSENPGNPKGNRDFRLSYRFRSKNRVNKIKHLNRRFKSRVP